MTKTLDDFMQDFTPQERAKVAARTAELIEEELTLRDMRRADLLLSTLSSYVAAMGGKLRLIAEFPNRHPVAIALADITGEPPPRKQRRRGRGTKEPAQAV